MVIWRRFAILGIIALLSACQNGEERAEAHYQRALDLIEEGDLDRARVEFLNVFQHDGLHRSARATFAAMLRDQGNVQESYSQYLRLIEQYPDHLEGRLALAEMALLLRNIEQARRHGARALELAPGTPRAAVIEVSLAYADAIEAEDEPARRTQFDRARVLLADDPDNAVLLRISIDNALRGGDFEGALAAVENNLATDPDNRFLHDIRLSVLAELRRDSEIEGQLQQMLTQFPEDEDLPGMILRYYMARGLDERAADFLRARAEAASDANARDAAMITLVQLRQQIGGPEAALDELDRIIAEAPDAAAIFKILRASILFEQGQRDVAVGQIETLLQTEGLSVTEVGQLRVTLARMLLTEGNTVGARAQIEQTLASDPTNGDALKMRAAWLIEEDEAERAIAMLRTALDGRPGDAEAMTLMARAYERNGNRQLAREFLSLAVEASGSAPEETLRYVDTLMEDNRNLTAEELLIDALRLVPDHPDLLATLARLYIGMEDWPRAQQVEAGLRETGDAARLRLADGLEATRLAAQGRIEDAVALVEAAAQVAGAGDRAAQISVVRARLISGDNQGALDYARALLAGAPEDLQYLFALGAVQSATGDLEGAEASFRDLTERAPDEQQAWIGLIRILNAQGRVEAARSTLDQALEALPEALDLLWAQASFLERAGEYDAAIEIYELMYARAPNAQVIANNLASLLATYRDDAESLDRAWTVARRLQGVEVASFQDTYGWIAYRRGEYEAALDHLEPAAQGLPSDPLVQFHLGMTYAAVNRTEAALAQLRLALEIAGPDDPRAQFDIARAEITRLEAAAAAEADATGETGGAATIQEEAQ